MGVKKKERKKEPMAKDSQLDQELRPRLEDQMGLVDPEINMELQSVINLLNIVVIYS